MASPAQALLSPAISTASSTANSVQHGRRLPMSRTHPLKPGSQKEISLINHVDEKILRVTRRYAKKFSNSREDADDTKGYVTFDEVVQDLDSIFQVVWISGTPTLQVPYLLSLAGLFCSYMPAFPFSPSMFMFVTKLDQGFAHLLRLPSCSSTDDRPYSVSMTDKVRIKSLAEETRVVAVDVLSEGGNFLELEDSDSGEEDHENDVGLSRIYGQTIEILGDAIVA